ncbi:Beta-xylosidase [uncultured Clostridium sp.]|uniref:glucosamine inositolphosphorylceramide transferase family protein n=1 Tax=uncultured Clostridium sp. TaxID=59620 RepID=UPI0008218FE9|nr:hypothetical protein [uncultured Clostridium sp.]SCJ73105.1 Beta-xylosidase [uncultured Clostridium sp.]
MKFFERIIKKLYYESDTWSIGIYEGEELNKIEPSKYVINPILKASDVVDCKARFVADPFIIKIKDKWYMFFEVYNEIKGKGVLAVATSNNGYKWCYEKIILEEDFHLSYPYVFEENNKIYMIPESGESGYIKLYEAKEFPFKWELVSNLIKGVYWDSSIIKYDDKYWLFTNNNESYENSLYLFYSDNLYGGWTPHPRNPIINNNRYNCRPAGRIVENNDEIYRYSQDCSEYYGKSVIGYKIKTLTVSEYDEEEVGVIVKNSGSKNSWNKDGMHTVDNCKTNNNWLVAVDGFYIRKSTIISKIRNKLNLLK